MIVFSDDVLTTSAGEEMDGREMACRLLKRGDLVAFPTETVYGLGADAKNPLALAKLYQAKGRPTNHPVIVHLSSHEQVCEWAVAVPDALKPLAERFWPGPLTVVLKRAATVLDQVTGGQDTVALRVPSHPVALALLKQFGGGLAAPSANRFGKISPTRAQDVEKEFGTQVQLILEGGPCTVGIESTILDLSGEQPRLLRPGMIAKEEIESVLGGPISGPEGKQQAAAAPRVPGSLRAHYAPATPLVLVSSGELSAKIDELHEGGATFVVLSFSECLPGVPQESWVRAYDNVENYARQLYANLRWLDTLNTHYILVERPPETAEWMGVLDRLTRAAAGNTTADPVEI